MRNKYKFIKDFSKFFTGALFAQIIGFALSPLLSRIYAPEDFGLFTLYIQTLSPLIVLGGSSLFLLLPKMKDAEVARNVFQISTFLSISVCLIVLLFVVFGLGSSIYLHILWPYIIVGILLSNIRGFFHFESLAEESFTQNSKAKIAESVVGSSANVGLGFLGFTTYGLIVGNMIGQLTFLIYFLRKYASRFVLYCSYVGFNRYIDFFRCFRRHFLFQTMNHLLEYLLVLFFSLLVTKLTSIRELGYFAFSYKIVSTPLNLIAEYFSQAALGRVSDFKLDRDRKLFFLKTSIFLVIPSFMCIVIFYFWGPSIFKMIFGEHWEYSGHIAKSYILAIVSTFFVKCFQYFPNVKNRHEIYTFFSVVVFGLPIGMLLFAQWRGIDFISSLEILSVIIFILAIIYFFTILRLFRTDSKD